MMPIIILRPRIFVNDIFPLSKNFYKNENLRKHLAEFPHLCYNETIRKSTVSQKGFFL